MEEGIEIERLTNHPLLISCGFITAIEDCRGVLSRVGGVGGALFDRDKVVWEKGSGPLLQVHGGYHVGVGQEGSQEGEGETGLHFVRVMRTIEFALFGSRSIDWEGESKTIILNDKAVQLRNM